MARFGNGYGSECHLLRYMGRHRGALDAAVREATGAAAVSWLDFPFAPQWPVPGKPDLWPDREWLSLDFLPSDSEVVRTWRERWPHGSGVMNWDEVGRASWPDGRSDWLLVEAKAHVGEIAGGCSAKAPNSVARIQRVMHDTKSALGVAVEQAWLGAYYQFANRLAVLQHLTEHGVGARLVFIYFVGDRRDDGAICPADAAGWKDALDAQDRQLGLERGHRLAERVHKIFLPVWSEGR